MPRALRTIVSSIVLLLALAACGGASGNGTLIGATCTDSAMCGPAGVCVTTGKDGECAIPCVAAGSLGECPTGTFCDTENVKSDVEPQGPMTLCLPACTSDSDCRNGYKCKGVSAGPGKICAPK
jgi:hypothetical protein